MTGSIAPPESIDLLLIEDDPGDARLTKEAFETVETDVAMQVIGDGVEAFEALVSRNDDPSRSLPDLVLLGLDLPEMNGFELLETVQTEPALERLPIVVLTSSTATDDVRESYQKCANAYVTKPTDPDALATIARAVERFWFQQAVLPPT